MEISRAGLHWDELDEDISINGLLAGRGDVTVPSVAEAIESHPKVFISHASEDKSFVVPFATALRTKGIDAWVDQWEIKLGDSLVQKIFEEGIRSAAIVIVVLSKISVEKKWVKEELDAAVVGRINQTSRLIPLLIEECDVPIALRATKWVRFHGDASLVVDEILHSIHGTSEKPQLGAAPSYVKSSPIVIHGLTSLDAQVLLAIGDRFIQKADALIEPTEIIEQLSDLQLRPSQVEESLEILSDNHFISPIHTMGHRFAMVRLEPRGAEIIFRRKFSDFDSYYRQISADLVNEERQNNEEIAKFHSLPLILVNHVLDGLESQGLIKMSKSIGGPRHVFEVSARLKRSL